VELVLAVVVVLATSVHLVRFVGIAWHVSLWHDELFSVRNYSGRGAGHVVTRYGSANNHVFFNLVNALTPGAGSVDPARARWWSIVAVLAMQAGILVAFWRRGWFLAGAVLFGLFATSPEWLDLVLQGRGYGFLGLAALLSCTTLWRYLEAPTRGPLAVLGLVTVAGTWTVPSYLLFAAPLWGLLLLAVRHRNVLVAAVLTGAGVAAVYLPVLGELRREQSTYEEQWGRSYTGLGDVAETVGTYVLRPSLFGGMGLGPVLTVVVLVAALAAAVVLPLAPVVRSLVLVLVGATSAFFVANLWLGTAVLRTTAFVTVPLAFALVVLVAGALEGGVGRGRGSPGGRPVAAVVTTLALVAVAVLTVQGVGAPMAVHRLPLQDWQGVGRYVDRTFPAGTGLVVNGPAGEVGHVLAYQRWSYTEAAPNVGEPGLASGRSVLVDSAASGEPAFAFDLVASVWSEARFPQRIGSYLRVLAAAPDEARVVSVLVDGRPVEIAALTDRRRATGPDLPRPAATVRIVPPAGQRTRSVALVAGNDLPAVRSVAVVVDGRVVTLGGDDVHRSGPSLTIAVGDRRVEAVEVTFAPGGADGTAAGSGPDLREVWTHPARHPVG
jgi:hypothetical protein